MHHITVSSADVDPSDTYGQMSITEVSDDDALDNRFYPAVVVIDTADGAAELALSGDQLLAVRDTLSAIIRNQAH